MARKHFLINPHTSKKTDLPKGNLKLGEIAVRHNEEAPELIIALSGDTENESLFRTFIDKVAIETLISQTNTNLSGEIDALSGALESHIQAADGKFATKTSVAEDIATAKDEAIAAASAYTDTEVTAAKNTLNEAINNVDSKVDTLASSAMTEIGKRALSADVNTLVENTSAATYNKAYGAASAYTDTQVTAAKNTLNEAINDVNSKVDTLVGNDSGKTARSIAVEEVAKVVSGAPEAFDTLKEIADWIGTASGVSAATLVADIENLKKADGELSESIQAVDSKVDKLATSAITEIDKRAIKTEVDTLVAETSAATYNKAYGDASAYTDTEVTAAKNTLNEAINNVDSKVDTLASSAMTEIGKRALSADVNTLVENTSAATYNKAYGDASAYTDTQVTAAKNTLTESINGIASRVESLESLSAATQSAIQTIEVSGVDGVKVTKSGTTRTIDFSEMTIDCGEF